jgi:hypothetical protein
MVQCDGEDGAAKLQDAIDPIQSIRLSADGIIHCSCGTCTKAAFSHSCADACCAAPMVLAHPVPLPIVRPVSLKGVAVPMRKAMASPVPRGLFNPAPMALAPPGTKT